MREELPDGRVRFWDGGGFVEYSKEYVEYGQKLWEEYAARLGLTPEQLERFYGSI